MWFWRRHRQLPASILLPSLDRLSELIEGVVVRLDEVALEHEPAPPAPEPDVAPAQVQAGHVLFVSAPDGYRLLQRDGPPPDRGAALALEDGAFLVLRLGPSPLPGDRRRCAFVEREEPSGEARTPDRVKEESQIEDMRAAVRGDRERAERARRHSSQNVRAQTEATPAAQPVNQPARAAEPRRSGLRGLFKRR